MIPIPGRSRQAAPSVAEAKFWGSQQMLDCSSHVLNAERGALEIGWAGDSRARWGRSANRDESSSCFSGYISCIRCRSHRCRDHHQKIRWDAPGGTSVAGDATRELITYNRSWRRKTRHSGGAAVLYRAGRRRPLAALTASLSAQLYPKYPLRVNCQLINLIWGCARKIVELSNSQENLL